MNTAFPHPLPSNIVIRNPAGTYSFVGRVDVRLAYVSPAGDTPTAEQLRTAARHGPRMAGLRSRTYPTAQAALDAAAALGVEATAHDS